MIEDSWWGCYGGSLKDWVVPAAFSHPAKFSRKLIERIYAHALEEGWLQPGQRVLDPMCGVAVGGVAAANAGLAWEGIELEAHFVGAGRATLEKHRGVWERMDKPLPTIRQGDARHLGGEGADCVVSSPPYADQALTGERNFQSRFQPDEKAAKDNPREGYAAAVFSPPYAQQVHGGSGIDPTKLTGNPPGPHSQVFAGGYSDRPTVEVIVTSPPFLSARSDTTPSTVGKSAPTQHDPEGMRRPQAIVSSPRYADAINAKGDGIDWAKTGPATGNRRRGPGSKHYDTLQAQESYAAHAGPTPGQLGALPVGDVQAVIKTLLKNELAQRVGTTYWETVAAIYRNCFALLPPGGHILLVLKGFVRKGQYVDLPDQTCQLLEAVGFRLLHRHKAWLVSQAAQARFDGGEDRREFKGFFRHIHERRGSPKIDFEEVVCAERARP